MLPRLALSAAAALLLTLSTTQVLAAQPAGVVQGRLTDSFGDPLPDAAVEAVSPSGYVSTVRTHGNGRYELPPLVAGTYRLTFSLDGYTEQSADVLVTAERTVRLAVSLEPLVPSRLAGTVVDQQGLALPGAIVEAASGEGAPAVATTDDAGRFAFGAVRPGPWRLAASMPGFTDTEVLIDVAFSEQTDVRIGLDLAYGLTEEVVVVGTRRSQGRPTVTRSPVPVDVLTAEQLRAQPSSDMAELVRVLAPSFNVNTQPISDAATAMRPMNFRNLAPDHMLVLVNGKRRHRGAVIAWLGNGLSDGSQGPDISTIPAIAVRQVELLRDGAAAQYGSDAIAGVLNFQLKDARQGGSFEYRQGLYADANAGDPATCGGVGLSCAAIGDRAGRYSVAGNAGLPLGNAGFINMSLEYGAQDPTNRAAQRDDAAWLGPAGGPAARDTAQVWGTPRIDDDLKLFVNSGLQLASGLRPYAYANHARRTVTGGFYYRHPHTRGGVFRGPIVGGSPTLLVGDRRWAETGIPGAGGCPAVPLVDDLPDPAALAAIEADPDCFTLYSRFPSGFTPQFGGTLRDEAIVAGMTHVRDSGLIWDASASLGRSAIDQFIRDTVNASLGYDTPTSFSPGAYEQEEANFNLDVAVPVGSRLHVAAGAERRTERFTIRPGDEPSWRIGPYAEQGFSSGSNGFNGYRPDTTAGSWARTSLAGYGDVEFSGLDGAWTLGSALRFEHFDDFGSTLNGKLAARRELTGAVSARGAISTGFRAPTPGQQNTFNVTTAFIDGQLTNNGVVPSTSGVALARGGGPLRPETSRNYSAGLVFDKGPMQLSADLFLIDVADRLALSQEIRLRPDEIEVLLGEGIAEARNFPVFRFFLNDFDTRTWGLDLVWSLQHGPNSLHAAWNHTSTTLLNLDSSVIDRFRVATLEHGLPVTRWSISARRDTGEWRTMARLAFYGSYWDSEDGRNAADADPTLIADPWLYPAYAGRALLDVEVSRQIASGAWLSVGAQNALNTYPEMNPYGAMTVGNRYGQFSPFGFDGAYYYARMGFEWSGR